LLLEEFGLLKLILHSKLRRRAASRRALPCPSSLFFLKESHTITLLSVIKLHAFDFSITVVLITR